MMKDDSPNVYWLPRLFSTNTTDFRTNVLAPYFTVPCSHLGFNLVLKGYEKSQGCAIFACQRHRFHTQRTNPEATYADDPDTQPAKKKNNTNRPVKDEQEETCKFRFSVFWDESKQRWYLPLQQLGNCHHNTGNEQENKSICGPRISVLMNLSESPRCLMAG